MAQTSLYMDEKKVKLKIPHTEILVLKLMTRLHEKVNYWSVCSWNIQVSILFSTQKLKLIVNQIITDNLAADEN